MELIVICSYQFYYSRAKVNKFPYTTKIFGKIFNRSETVVTPMYLPCKSHFYHKIIHRLSIGNPSILHRFDGLTMEMRWRSDGDTTEAERNCNLLLVTKVKRYYFVHNSLVILNIYTNFAPRLRKCTGLKSSTYIL